MTGITITNTTVACYLLRSDQIRSLAEPIIKTWLECAGNGRSKTELSYSKYIKAEVVVNAVPLETVWNAILASDHIWFFSHFEEESASLYWKLLQMAKKSNIRERIFFNMAEKGRALQSLQFYCKQAKMLMDQLEMHNNLRFFFFEDINEIITTGMQNQTGKDGYLPVGNLQKTAAIQHTNGQLNGTMDYRRVIAALKKLGVRGPLSDEEKAVLDAFAAISPEHNSLVAKIGDPHRVQQPQPLTGRRSQISKAMRKKLYCFSVVSSLHDGLEIRKCSRQLLQFLMRFAYTIAHIF